MDNDDKYPLSDETYKIIGICMEIHKILGGGLMEVIYKDALEYEFEKRNLFFEREKEYEVVYKGKILKHKFYVDFVVNKEIILEIKSQQKDFIEPYYKEILNYLKISRCRVGLLINFGNDSLFTKRIIL